VKDSKIVYILLLIVSTVLGGIGQFFFKYAFLDGSLALTLVAGLAIYAISTGVYFYVLSRTHLSWAYALSGISYIVAVFLAASFLGENVTLIRWAGVLVIAIGVVLVSIS
jgi:uncharacterized membrane protein